SQDSECAAPPATASAAPRLPRPHRAVSFLVMTLPPSDSRGQDRVRALSSLSQTIDVETPELVVFSYTIAGVGSRALAALIDSLICIGAILAIIFTLV